MKQRILLISTDGDLAARVARALPAAAAVELVTAAALPAAARSEEDCLLALFDVRAAGAVEATPAALQVVAVPVPTLWLGEPPRLAAGVPAREMLPGPIVDYLDRGLPVSKLAFILDQHLTAERLRRRRLPGRAVTPPASSGELRAQINNDLTAILGNAELASTWLRSGARRMPPPVSLRLERILEVAVHLRQLIAASPWGPESGPQAQRPVVVPDSGVQAA
ncbi:MAG TPA: hypothetical protein VIE13_03670 [Terriglobales bacterium]